MTAGVRAKLTCIYFTSALILTGAIPDVDLYTKSILFIPITSLGLVPFLAFLSSNENNFQAFARKPSWTPVLKIVLGSSKKRG